MYLYTLKHNQNNINKAFTFLTSYLSCQSNVFHNVNGGMDIILLCSIVYTNVGHYI